MKRWLARRAWRAATTCAVNELRARDAFMAQRPKRARVSAAPSDPLLALLTSRFDRKSQNSDRFTRKESSSQSVRKVLHRRVPGKAWRCMTTSRKSSLPRLLG